MKNITILDQLDSTKKFTFYDNDLGTILRSFEGFEYATVRESIDDVAGTTGAIYINSKFGRRRLAFIGDLIGTDVFLKRRQLVTVLRQTGTIKLIKFTTYDDLALQCEAEVVKYGNPYNHQVHTFLIELIAPDYRFYSQELFSQNLDQTILQGGASIPSAVPMLIPLSTTPETELQKIVTSNGTEATDPTFTITGPGDTFIIGNETSGKEFTLNLVLDSDDTVVVNVKERTVIKNGITNVYADFDGDFWQIEPGENELRFLVSTDFDIMTQLNVSYRDAYAGV